MSDPAHETRSTPAADQRLLTFASGGWVLAVAVVLVAAIVVWQLTIILPTLGTGGRISANIDSYGFDLSNLSVPRDLVVSSGFPPDGLPELTNVQYIRPDEVAALHEELADQHIYKAIVDSELVIGVEFNGESRAYPKRILTLHEVYNDTVGGVPIAVTYHPLCDSVVVFSREVGGEVLEFGVSGLLYNCNLVLYDRRPQRAAASLWSQLGRRAIGGPLNGTPLNVLPAQVCTWREWRQRDPDTVVVLPPSPQLTRYKRVSYGMYRNYGEIPYPVRPQSPAGDLAPMTPGFAVAPDETWRWFAVGRFPAEPLTPGNIRLMPSGEEGAWISASDRPPVLTAFHFAWYAFANETGQPAAAAPQR